MGGEQCTGHFPVLFMVDEISFRIWPLIGWFSIMRAWSFTVMPPPTTLTVHSVRPAKDVQAIRGIVHVEQVMWEMDGRGYMVCGSEEGIPEVWEEPRLMLKEGDSRTLGAQCRFIMSMM